MNKYRFYSKDYDDILQRKALSPTRIKRALKEFLPRFSSITIVVAKPTKEDGYKYKYYPPKVFDLNCDHEEFVAEMGMLADLHCIVKLGNNVIWLRQANDPKELNIDDKVLGRMLKLFAPIPTARKE